MNKNIFKTKEKTKSGKVPVKWIIFRFFLIIVSIYLIYYGYSNYNYVFGYLIQTENVMVFNTLLSSLSFFTFFATGIVTLSCFRKVKNGKISSEHLKKGITICFSKNSLILLPHVSLLLGFVIRSFNISLILRSILQISIVILASLLFATILSYIFKTKFLPLNIALLFLADLALILRGLSYKGIFSIIGKQSTMEKITSGVADWNFNFLVWAFSYQKRLMFTSLGIALILFSLLILSLPKVIYSLSTLVSEDKPN